MKSRNRANYKPANEYYTPSWIFEALQIKFDLDVCSPKDHVTAVPADKRYTIDDDGLMSPWEGRVWMNPPFSFPTPWIDKFIQHGNGISLTAMSRSNAFVKLWNNADAVLALPSNLKFMTQDDKMQNVFMPCMLSAFGQENVDALSKIEGSRVR